MGFLGTLLVSPALAEVTSAPPKAHQTHGQPQFGCFKAPPLTEGKSCLLPMCLAVKQDILGPMTNAFV